MEQINFSVSAIKFLNILKKRWIIIVILAVIGNLAYGYYTDNYVPKIYQASVKMYVAKTENTITIGDQTYTSYSDVTSREILINDALVITRLEPVAKKVNKGLEEKGFTPGGWSLSSAVDEGTRFFTLMISGSDPDKCNAAVTLLADASIEEIKKLLLVENVAVVTTTKCGAPIAPSVATSRRNGTIIGIVLGVAIIFLIAFFDRTIKDEDEFHSLFGDIPVIGSIPEFNLSAEKSAAKSGQKRAKRHAKEDPNPVVNVNPLSDMSDFNVNGNFNQQ